MKCSNCGSDITENMTVCPECGHSFDNNESETGSYVRAMHSSEPIKKSKREIKKEQKLAKKESKMDEKAKRKQNKEKKLELKEKALQEDKTKKQQDKEKRIEEKEKKHQEKEKKHQEREKKLHDTEELINAKKDELLKKINENESVKIAKSYVVSDDEEKELPEDTSKIILGMRRETIFDKIRDLPYDKVPIKIIGIAVGVILLFMIGSFVISKVTECSRIEEQKRVQAALEQERNTYNNENARLKDRAETVESNEKGVKLETKIKTTDWLVGSDMDVMKEAWEHAGAEAEFPKPEDFNKYAQGGISIESFEDCAVMIGSIEFKNLTANEIRLDQYTNTVKAYMNISENGKEPRMVYKAVFNPKKIGRTQKKSFGIVGGNQNNHCLIMDDEISGNPFGPCPFMVVACNAFKDEAKTNNANSKSQLDASSQQSSNNQDASGKLNSSTSQSTSSQNLSSQNLSSQNMEDITKELEGNISFKVQFFTGSFVDYFGDKETGYFMEWDLNQLIVPAKKD